MNGETKRTRLDQRRAPIHEALENFRRMRVVPFDVPGHKRGRGNPELTAFLGQQCVGVDVNSMKPLDNLCHPVSVIREAEELAADAFGAAHAFLMVGGTTSSVQSMVLTACKRGDEIILPRNVHRSVLNALVLCGAVPVYVNLEVDNRLGISLGMKREQVAKAIAEHPNAVAVLVNNPTYYGICSDLRAIVRMAHDAGMLCLADEAHGTHFYFGGGLPVSAMAAGADMASVSMHKSGGSLTQSSLLLTGPNVHAGYVRQIINLTQTTSGSYLLMSSLDISRRNLALRGRQVFHQVADMAEYAREEINAVGGYYAFGKELCNGNSVFDFDTTKLSVHTLDIGLAGIEVYDILRDEYDIQIEFGDIGNILAYLSIGDRPQEVERLVSALAEIKRRYHTDGAGLLSQEYIDPEVAASPQEAFYAPKKSLPLRETEGMVCSEFVMCYPPGIPILAPGERITAEILDYIEYAKAKGCSMTGPEDPDIHTPDVKHSIRVNRQLYSKQSDYQRIDIFETPEFGRVLTLDGNVMLTERDEFIYDEMITHVPMSVHKNAKDILVIGAGDGGVVRELTRYDRVESIDLVEMDPQVIEACRAYLPGNACRMDDRRVHIYYENALKFIRKCEDEYDLIIVDSSDPFGPSEGLFTREFYGSCFNALRADGIMVNQQGSPFYAEDATAMQRSHQRIASTFPISKVYQAHIPTFAAGYWLFGFASKKYHPINDMDADAWNALNMRTRYYTSRLHVGAFYLPAFLEEMLREVEEH